MALGQGITTKRLQSHLGTRLVDETLVDYANGVFRIAYLRRHDEDIVSGIEVFSPKYVAEGGVRVGEAFNPATARESGYHCLAQDSSGTFECLRRNVVIPGLVIRVKDSHVISMAVFANSIEQLS
jgi:hypothetical protein